MSKSLLMFDTDRIKSYVFATDKLREIRAASAILDQLNRSEMAQAIDPERGEKTIFANGGSGLFVVDSGRVKAIKQRVEAAYNAKTAAATITGVDLKAPDPLTGETDITRELQTLGYLLRLAKDGHHARQAVVTHAYFNFCSSCGVQYAVETDVEDNRPVLICRSCAAKRKRDKRIREEIGGDLDRAEAQDGDARHDLWSYLIGELRQREYPYLDGYNRPETFGKLAELSSPKEYIGLIYADGDAMGRQIDTIKTLPQMEDFAKAVDDSIYEAAIEAILTHLQPAAESDQKVWPFDILLIGGDDLVMVTRAESALEVAAAVMRRFTELTGEKYSRRYPAAGPLHLSVGVAIAHANYPFGELLRLAESALKFAKKKAAKRRQVDPTWGQGMLNFLVVSNANHLDFDRFYREQLRGKVDFSDQDRRLYRSLRPYSGAQFDRLIAAARRLKTLKTPRTKLEQLRALLFQNKRQAMVDSLSLLFNWRSDEQRGAIQEIVADFSPDQAEHGLAISLVPDGNRAGRT